MKKIAAGGLVSLLIAGGLAIAGTSVANAAYDENCVPSDAWDETVVTQPYVAAVPAIPGTPEVLEVSHDDFQRYSWTGGPTEYAPTETPPSDNWQANTDNYEGAGHGDDPIGQAFSKNDNGKGDWFFWTKTHVIDQPYVAGTPEIPGTPEVTEVSHIVHHDAVICDQPPTPIEFCTASVDHPVATNLAADGWNIKPNRGEFVDGGLHLFATADSSGWAQKTINTPLANVGSLVTIYSDKTGPYTFGVILTLNSWDQQIHYDEDGRYWTDISGIFPESTLKGGYYETYNLEADLLSNVNIQTIVLYVNAGQGGLTIHSQGYQCDTQAFDHESVIVIPTQPEARVEISDASVTNCDAKTVTTTTTTKTYGSTYDEESNTWVENAEPEVVSTDVTRDATTEECPVVVVVTPTPTPVVNTPAAVVPDASGQLAQTGSDMNVVWIMWFVGLVMALGAAFLGGSYLYQIKRNK